MIWKWMVPLLFQKVVILYQFWSRFVQKVVCFFFVVFFFNFLTQFHELVLLTK